MSSNNYKHIKISKNTGADEFINWFQNSFWQSHLWAEILRDTHQARDILLCTDEEHSILLERRKIIGKYTGLYALGVDGNLISDDFLAFVKNKIANKNDLFLQIEPLIEPGRAQRNPRKAPFRRFIEPTTALIQLTDQTQDLLLANFTEKGRYNIRLAQKRWLTTKWVKGYEIYRATGKTYLEEFFNLLDETTKRDGFSHNMLTYYRYFVETLEAHNAGGLLIAEKDNILHAAGIFAYWGWTGIYYYGASASDKEIRRDMGTYLLQWEAICEARRRACTTYDFLWISPDGKGKLAWVTEFKLRFHPEKKTWPEEEVFVFKPFLLKILQGVSKLRKLFR